MKIVHMENLQKTPPEKSDFAPFATFFIVFCDFFESYGSNPKTIIMFFVVLWEVVPPLKAILRYHDPESRKSQKTSPKMTLF